jgi:leader peptidase (prepilin peptidase) / N-methyltransferase
MIGLLVGAALGSHAGVALTRWTRGCSVTCPARSCCDACGAQIRRRDLVPIVSWLVLRGRCRDCSAIIDPRLPAMEAGCAALGALAVGVLPTPLHRAAAVLAGSAVILATATDLERRIIPDRLTVPLAIVAIPLMSVDALLPGGTSPERVGSALAGVLLPAIGVPAGLIAVNVVTARLLAARAIGGGDIKLLVGLMAVISSVPNGPTTFWLTVALLGGVVALGGLLTGRLVPSDRIPLAPFLLLGFVAVLIRAPSAGLDSGGPW